MSVLGLLGRLVVAWLFLASAAGNIVRTGRVAAHARARNLPSARTTTLVAGYLMAALGLAIAFGVWLDLAVALGALFLVGVAVVMHPFWSVSGLERERMNVQFWKDLALAGALVAWLAALVEVGDVPFALTGLLL
jgi:putative oxidoreductase